ncbi:triose-phosphate transporter family-domain-containing protein [Phycomyces nitens]|nr:triose-phosphate transporter family-domain-containing protein [Phycomyces nitens]
MAQNIIFSCWPKGRSIDSPIVWIAMYLFLTLTLAFYNKIIMTHFEFPFPWTLVTIQTLCGSIGSTVYCSLTNYSPVKLKEAEYIAILLCSVLYTINIAISNLSLQVFYLFSYLFHQVVRAMSPVFVIMFSRMFMKNTYPRIIYCSLLPASVVFATFGNYNYTKTGFLLTVLGTILAAINTIVINRVQVGRLELHPIDLLLRIAPLEFLQAMLHSHLTGEISKVNRFFEINSTWLLSGALLVNGLLGFFVSMTSFIANKKTSPLTMTVVENAKQVLSIGFSLVVFKADIISLGGLGILLTLTGGIWYM